MAEVPGLALQAPQLSDQVSLRARGTRGQNAELQVTCTQCTSLHIKPSLKGVLLPPWRSEQVFSQMVLDGPEGQSLLRVCPLPETVPVTPTLCDSILVTMSLVTPHFEGPSPVLVAFMVDKLSQIEFSPGTSMFPSHYNSANVLYAFVHLLLTMYRLTNRQRLWIKNTVCFWAHLNLSQHFTLQSWYCAK